MKVLWSFNKIFLAFYVYFQSIQSTARTLKVNPSTSSSSSGGGNSSTTASTEVETAPLVSLNFVMQFLFHELKNSNRVRKWFYRKLSLELDELIAKTTTGKLLDKLTVSSSL